MMLMAACTAAAAELMALLETSHVGRLSCGGSACCCRCALALHVRVFPGNCYCIPEDKVPLDLGDML